MKSKIVSAKDLKILNLLQENAALTNRQVAKELGTSPVSILNRLRKLLEHKIIKGYKTVTNVEYFGYTKKAFVTCSIGESDVERFLINVHMSKYVTTCAKLKPKKSMITTVNFILIIEYKEKQPLKEITDFLTNGVTIIFLWDEQEVQRIEKRTEVLLDMDDL